MQDDITNERIVHGLITLFLLRELVREPMHGYELQKKVSDAIERPMPPGSVYVLLKGMKSRGFVKTENILNEKGQILTMYHITEGGKKFLCSHSESLIIARKMIDDLISTVQSIEDTGYQ
ncbi:MAG: PadR family transcriptional regulator [Thermoplasmata archaeon]